MMIQVLGTIVDICLLESRLCHGVWQKGSGISKLSVFPKILGPWDKIIQSQLNICVTGDGYPNQ